MLKSNFKQALRQIIRHKYYSFINIFGLTISLSAIILIALFIFHELRYDRHFKDVDQVYRIVRKQYVCSPPPIASALKSNIPEIINSSGFIIENNELIGVGDKQFSEPSIMWSNNELFSVFSFDFIHGDPYRALSDPSSVVLSESISKKYFGEQNPMGSAISFHDKVFIVRAVFKDLPVQTHFQASVILPKQTYFEISGNDSSSWRSNYAYSYIKLNKNANADSVNNKIVKMEKAISGWTADAGIPYEQYFFLQPVTDIHLYSHRQQELQANGSISIVYIYSIVALLILLIAIINYGNITVAKSDRRKKEFGIRKAIGAHKLEIIKLILLESVIISVISTILAILLVFVSLDHFSALVDRDIQIPVSWFPLLGLSLFILALIVGLLAGIIPLKLASKISVSSIMKGRFTPSKENFLSRNALIMVQFTIAISLIIVSINVRKQIQFVLEKDPGYKKSGIVNVKLYDPAIPEKFSSFKERLLSDQTIKAISVSQNLPHQIKEFRKPDWYCISDNNCPTIFYNVIDYDYLDLYELEIKSGRNFSPEFPSDKFGAFIINEKAAEIAGWDHPIGKEISHYDGTSGKIVGVVENFNFQSFHSEIAPLYLMLGQSDNSFLSIRISTSNISESLATIEKVYRDYSPNTTFDYSFFEDLFRKEYTTENRMSQTFSLFSALSILMSCLGLFGVSSFQISRKIKEVGVRKILGATNTGLMILFGKKLLIPVFLSNIIAWPLAYMAITYWLESFAFRTEMSLWPFLIATATVLGITIFTLTTHIGKIAHQNPTLNLQSE